MRDLAPRFVLGLAAVLPASAVAQQPPFMGGLQGERTTPPLLMQSRLERDGTTTGMHEWARQANRAVRERLPMPVFVRVSAVGAMKLNFFDAKANPIPIESGAVVGMRSRFRYVFAVENLAAKPDARYYGSMEVVYGPWLPPTVSGPDCPVAVAISDQDALSLTTGAMVTKIIVLENPATASPVLATPDVPLVYDAADAMTAIEEAKRRGRIFMIVRIGDRKLESKDIVGLAAADSLFLPNEIGEGVAKAGGKLSMSHFKMVAGGEQVGESEIQLASHTVGGHGKKSSGDDCAECDKLRFHWGGQRREKAPQGPGQAWPGYVPLPPAPRPVGFTPFFDRYDDEWVCDGADRSPKVGYDNFGRLINVDAGDTIGLYRDNDGRKRFAESNLACVYSPRYVEIRAAQNVEGYERWLTAQRVRQYDYRLGMTAYKGSDVAELAEQAEGIHGRLRASGLHANAWAGSFSEVRMLEGWEQVVGHHVDKNYQFALWLKNHEQFFVKRHVEFAKTLTRNQYPIMVSAGVGHGQTWMSEGDAEIRKIDVKPGRPARLILEKTVDRPSAKPGETVTFILRYTNAGDEPMTSVAVIDSLPARLELVPGTAKSSADAVFTAEDNDVGSSILRWELKAPLKGKATGTVEFQARLR